MTRFGVLVAAVAGALLAVTVGAAPTVADMTKELDTCYPASCMSLVVMSGHCIESLDWSMLGGGAVSLSKEATKCVCADPKEKEAYLDCNGSCQVDEATEPYCGQPVKADIAPTVADTTKQLDNDCNAQFCMSVTLWNSHCADGKDPALLGGVGLEQPNEATDCICADPEEKKKFLGCYGFCGPQGFPEPGAPYCAQSATADAHVEENVDDDEAVDAQSLKYDPKTGMQNGHPYICHGPLCEGKDPRMMGASNFCGVPGQACLTNAKVIDTDDTELIDANVTEVEHPEVTATAELEERDELVERDPKLPPYWWFCGGVPYAACLGEKVAAPTADAGSHFVDVGDVQSESLEGKIADGAKRDAAVAAPVPTTLKVVKDYLRPSI